MRRGFLIGITGSVTSSLIGTTLIKATAIAPMTAGIATARKFILCGNSIPNRKPIKIGPTIAPIRPTAEAQPIPVERTANG